MSPALKKGMVKMSQKLILPIDNCRVTAGYKSDAYKKQMGFLHYGTDMVSALGSKTVNACGDGFVVAAGSDGATQRDRMGNCIVVVYNDVLLPDGTITDLACRMFHFSNILVKPDEKISQGQPIATYGNTGRYSIGAHLHIEFDTDAKHPQYAVGLLSSGRVILKGSVDSTLSANKVLFLTQAQKISANLRAIAEGWVRGAEVQLKPW